MSLNFSDQTPCHMLGTNIEFKFSIFFKLRYILASFGFGILNEFAAKDAHFAHIVCTEKKLAFLAMSDYPVETNFFLITSYFLIWICKNCKIVCQNCNFHILFSPSDLLKWRKVVEWWELFGHFFCKKILKVSFIWNLKRAL